MNDSNLFDFDDFEELGGMFDEDPFAGGSSESETVSAKSKISGAMAADDPAASTGQESASTAAPVTIKPEEKVSGDPEDPPVNILQKAAEDAENAETWQTAKSVFALPAIFDFDGIEEEIENADISFDELRNLKKIDFPQLEEGRKVSWTISYGSITKAIYKTSQKISDVRLEVEQSKEFFSALKKAKDKCPRFRVKPAVQMKNKGTASYKAICSNIEEAEQSEKPICIFPGRNGQLYLMRKKETGTFITSAAPIEKASEVSVGFRPTLPLIPFSLFNQIISFFREYSNGENVTEALAQIYWDRQEKKFTVFVPEQIADHTHVEAVCLDQNHPDESRYLYYADIHSHNLMDAFFSAMDDRDEKATGLYFVVGNLNHFFPSVRARISNGGRYLEIPVDTVVEAPEYSYPVEWKSSIRVSHENYKELLDDEI